MSSVDERIVQMQFDNKAFEQNVSTSLNSLNKLDKSINDIDGSHFSGLSKSIDSVSDRFSNLGIVGMTVIQNLTNRVVDLGVQMVKSLTIDNIEAGFAKYTQATKDIKALMNSTGEDVDAIDAQLERLSWYSDATSYSYNAMVTALKSFAAQDIGLDDAIPMIMGIGNSLSYAGLAAEEASSAFNIYSKAIGQGYMSNIQWKSLNLMGASTVKLKEDFIKAGLEAKTLRQNLDGTIETVDGLDVSVREFESTLSAKGGKWVTAEVMERVFKNYGNYSSKLQNFSSKLEDLYGIQLSVNQAMELYDYIAKDTTGILAGDNGFSNLENSASKTAKEFRNFIEDLTGVNLTISEAIELSGTLDSELGGISVDDFGKRAFLAAQEARTFAEAIGAVRDAASSAWRSIFEKIFGNAVEATELWSNFSDWLYDIFITPLERVNQIAAFWKKIGGRDLLLDAFKAWADIIPTAKEPIVKAFEDIFGTITNFDIVAKITVITGRLRDFATKLSEWLTKRSDKIQSIFKGFFALIDIFKTVLGGIIKFAGHLLGVEGGVLDVLINLAAKFGEFIVKVRDFIKTNPKFLAAIEFIKAVIEKPISLFQKLNEQLEKTGEETGPLEKFKNVLGKIGDIVGKVWEKLKEILAPIKDTLSFAFGDGLNFNNLIKLLTVIGTIDFAKNLKWMKDEGGGKEGIFKTFFGFINQVKYALESLEESMRAKGIKDMAIAIGILAVSLLLLASIDPTRLGQAMIALAIGLQMLFGTMEKSTKLDNKKGLNGKMAALIELSIALLILSAAVKTLSKLDIGGLMQGLIGVFLMLTMLSGFMKNLGNSSFQAGSVSLSKNAKHIIAMSIALLILTASIKILGSMDLIDLAKGLAAVLIFLNAFAGITKRVNKDAKAIKSFASAMIPMALGLLILSAAIKVLGGMSLDELITGLVGVAGGMLIMGLALKYFDSNTGVAASILIMSVGLIAFAAAIKILASLNFKQVGVALLALIPILLAAFLMFKFLDWKKALGVAASLVVFAAALDLMVPALAAFAALKPEGIVKAIALIAGVLLVLGVSAYALSGLILPMLGVSAALLLFGIALTAVGTGLVALSGGIAVIGPALTVLVQSILTSLPDILTALVLSLGTLIVALCKAIIAAVPAIIEAIDVILEEALKWLKDELPILAAWLGEAIVKLLAILAIYIPKIVDQLFALLIALIEGLATTIEERGMALIEAVVHLVKALFTLIFDVFKWFYNDVLKAGWEWVKNFFAGIEEKHQESMDKIGEFILSLVDAIKSKWEEFKEAAKELISGFISGITEKIKDAVSAVKDFASDVVTGVKDFFGISSPSKVMAEIGEYTGEGFIVGLNSYSATAEKEATGFGEGIMNAIMNPLLGLNNLGLDDENLNPVITPVLDLSEIQNGNNILSSMFQGNNPRLAIAGISGESKYSLVQDQLLSNLNNPNGMTFIQNNYSPKALSRIDIYRQTKNQLSAAKGGV